MDKNGEEAYIFIPQGTVHNILGPDRLASQKALDPNYFRRKLFDCTTFVWKS